MANSSPTSALLLALALSGSTWAESPPGNGSEIGGGSLQQQYTHQYAKQFAQYSENLPQFASGSNATTGKSASSGDFHEYVRDYAGHGDYQRYLRQGGAQQPQFGGNQTQGQSYQRYVDKYAGGHMDFMGQAGASNVSAPSAQHFQSGGYQRLVDQYAGGYVDFMGQMGASNVSAPSVEASATPGGSNNKEWAAHYMRAYAAEYQKYMTENSSNYSVSSAQHVAGSNMTQDDAIQRWGKTSMDKYAAPFEHYMHRQAAASIAPASASSCHTVSELQAWRAAKLEQITSYVPQAYRSSAKDAVERTFHSNRARIEREQAIQAQRLADKEASTAAREGSAAPADKKAGKEAQQGSATTADERAGKTAQDGPAAPADDKPVRVAHQGSTSAAGHVQETTSASASGDGGEREASNGTTAAVGSANRKTDQGSADQATATPPLVATNASTVQLAGEGSAELVRETPVDRSVASIAALAVLGALLGAYVGKGRRRQRAMEPEGYVNLLAEP